MSFTEDSSVILDARYLTINNVVSTSGFPLDAPDGSVASPPYTFERNTATGMSLVADNLVFGVDGVPAVVTGMEGNVSIGPAPSDFGTTPGEGVLFINNVTTVPVSGTPGGLLFVDGSSLNYTNTLGDTTVISAKTGDVFGPVLSTINSVASFVGVTGKLIKATTLHATETSTLLTADGSTASGAYAFTVDPDTGINLDSGIFRVHAGNQDKLHILPTSVSIQDTGLNVWVPDGTSGAPAYSFTSAPTSGVFLNGTDVGVSSGGLTGLVVENVGGAVPNVALAGPAPSDYGAGTPGVGVVFLPEASVVPSGVPNLGSGSILYVSGGDLYALNSDGVARDLTRCVEETSGTTTLNGVVRFSGTAGNIVQDTTTLTVNSTGQWAGPDGSLAAVTYGFNGDANTGMYSEGVGVINLVAGGLTQMRLSTTSVTFSGDLLLPDGSQTAPAYAFAPTSGIFLDSDSVCVSGSGECALASFNSRNVSMCGPASDDFGGGDRTIRIHQVTTVPTTNPTGGSLMYVDGDELCLRTPSGTVFVLTDGVEGPSFAADEAFVVYDGTTGKFVQNSGVSGSNTGIINVSNGLVSAPSYSFINAPDTGMYLSGTDVHLTSGGGVGGGGQLVVDGTTVTTYSPLLLSSGTVSLPGVTFTGDLNTGVYLASGQLSFSAGGVNGLTLAPDGNVSLTGAPDFGGGENVVRMEEVGVVPVGTLSSGALVYVSGNNIIMHDDAGTASTLTSSISGPSSTAANQLAFWADTTGSSFDTNASVLVSTQLQAAEFRVDSGTASITNDTSRVKFASDTGTYTLVGSSEFEMVGIPLHADLDLEVGGSLGLVESSSGTVHTSNSESGSGTFEWRQDGSKIFETVGLDVSTPNSYIFPNSTETLSIGNGAGTKYTIASTTTGISADTISFSIGGVVSLAFTDSDATVGDAMTCPTVFEAASGSSLLAPNGTVSSPSYTWDEFPTSGMFYDAANTSLCMSFNSKLSFVMADAPTATNIAICVDSVPTSYNGGDGVVYVGEVISEPTGNATGSGVVMYVNSDDDMRMVVDTDNSDENSTVNALARRALITITGYTVSDATSDDLDGETWVDVDSAGVSGTTTGSLNIPSIDTTVMIIAQATWVSNSTGYRRVSITSGVGHTVESSVTTPAVNGDVTSQTVTLVRRVEVANLQFATQVYQNSGGGLDVDVTMTLVRLN